MLYPENRSYLDDILSYEAIGARSVENQQHRLTASGMDIPVGMKNPTSGDFSVMLNSVIAAQSSHTFYLQRHGCNDRWKRSGTCDSARREWTSMVLVIQIITMRI